MVVMLVRQKHACQVLRFHADLTQPFRQLTAADANIDQKSLLAGTYHGSVAFTAAGQDRDRKLTAHASPAAILWPALVPMRSAPASSMACAAAASLMPPAALTFSPYFLASAASSSTSPTVAPP